MSFYFGCKSETDIGHYLYDEQGSSGYRVRNALPFRYEILDGLFKYQEQSQARIFWIAGYTVIWMPDRSADKRFGSCAAFVIEGTFLQWNEATAKAKVLFPWAWKRIDATAPIHLFGDKSNEEKL